MRTFRRSMWFKLTALVTFVMGALLTRIAFWQHERFFSFGFDVGIFAQGTWLLSHFERPFVTIRGLDLFGDHASYILVLVAPLYRIFDDPRLLLLLQVVALVAPAFAIRRIAADRVGEFAGFACAGAYLLYPAMNSAALWQFHPESLAVPGLAFGALAAFDKRWKTMAVLFVLAMLCKEDVSLVVAGFGLHLVTHRDTRRIGLAVVAAGVAYFAVTSFVLIPAVNTEPSLYLKRYYGIDASGIGGILSAVPVLAGNIWDNVTQAKGIGYLLIVFGPFAFLPLLAPRMLLPVAAPLLLNLASNVDYQRSADYQYLTTSAPMLAIAAVFGLMTLPEHKRTGQACAAVMLVLAVGWSAAHGPIQRGWDRGTGPVSASEAARVLALHEIPAGAGVSAQANTVAQIADRKYVYEFPNPFVRSNWGVRDEPKPEAFVDPVNVDWVLVDPASLGPRDAAVLADLRNSAQWEEVRGQGVVLLRRL